MSTLNIINNIKIKNNRLELPIISILLVASMLEVYLGELILFIFTISVLILFHYLPKGLSRTVTVITWSMASSTGGEVLLVLSIIASILAVLSHRTVELKHEGLPRPQSWVLMGVMLFYLPLIILNPVTLLVLIIYILIILIKLINNSYKLLSVEVVAPSGELTAVFEEETVIPININSKYNINYFIILDGKIRSRGSGKGNLEAQVKIKPRILGESRHVILVEVYDEDYWASRSLGPFNTKIKTTLKSIRALARIRRVLLRYREYLAEPLIYRVKISRLAPEGGGAIGAQGTGEGGLGPGAGGAGYGGLGLESGRAGRPLRSIEWELERTGEALRLLFIPAILSEGTSGKWSIYGDYAGAREYQPGDKPRDIHWKKSAARRELIVKVYEPGSGGGGGGKGALIIADWVARNPEELDELVKKTYSALLSVQGEKILFLRTPKGKTYFIRGSLAQALYGLDQVMRSEGITLPYSYEGWRRRWSSIIARSMEETGEPLTSITRYYQLLGMAIAEALARMGVRKGTPYYLINSDATSLRNHFIGIALTKLELAEGQVPLEDWEKIIEKTLSQVRRLSYS